MASPEPIRSLTEPFDTPPDPTRRRLLTLAGLSAVGLASVTIRTWYLQIVHGASYRSMADDNRYRARRLDPPRGAILDRNEIALARNRPSYAIAIVYADLPKEKPERIFGRLSRLIGISENDIAFKVSKRQDDFSPISILTSADPKIAYIVDERALELPGVVVSAQAVREYLDGLLTSHLVGFLGRINQEEYTRVKGDTERHYTPEDLYGKTGLELVLESDLRGRPGRAQSEVNSAGRDIKLLGADRPTPGRNVVLTIDMPLQREITRLLQEDLARFESASVVALDPRNGQVLALVHLPSYDNNLFSRALSEEDFDKLMKDPRRPMVNGAITDAYSPGSTFNIVTAIAALQTNVMRPDSKIDCPGALIIPNRFAPGGQTRIPCWTVHGSQDCATALANSCNVYFYHASGGDPRGLGDGIEIDRLSEYAIKFGLGEPSEIGLPGEESGIVPNPAWKRRVIKEPWYKGDTYNVSIGQGFVTATSMQMANMIATVANGGRLFKPQLVSRLTDEHGQMVRGYQPIVKRDLQLDPDKLRVVHQGLRYAMQIGRTENGTSYTGTSWEYDLRDLAIAGKTGTAEWGTPNANGIVATHGWFVGFAPFGAPQIALSVFVKRGRGPDDATRVARRILAFYFGVTPN